MNTPSAPIPSEPLLPFTPENSALPHRIGTTVINTTTSSNETSRSYHLPLPGILTGTCTSPQSPLNFLASPISIGSSVYPASSSSILPSVAGVFPGGSLGLKKPVEPPVLPEGIVDLYQQVLNGDQEAVDLEETLKTVDGYIKTLKEQVEKEKMEEKMKMTDGRSQDSSEALRTSMFNPTFKIPKLFDGVAQDTDRVIKMVVKDHIRSQLSIEIPKQPEKRSLESIIAASSSEQPLSQFDGSEGSVDIEPLLKKIKLEEEPKTAPPRPRRGKKGESSAAVPPALQKVKKNLLDYYGEILDRSTPDSDSRESLDNTAVETPSTHTDTNSPAPESPIVKKKNKQRTDGNSLAPKSSIVVKKNEPVKRYNLRSRGGESSTSCRFVDGGVGGPSSAGRPMANKRTKKPPQSEEIMDRWAYEGGTGHSTFSSMRRDGAAD